MTRREFALAGAFSCAALALGLSACSPSGTGAASRTCVVVCLDDMDDAYAAGVHVAVDRNYFGANGIDVELVSPQDGADAVDAVDAGDACFCLSSQERLARAFGVPEPACVIAVAALGSASARKGYEHLVVGNDAYLVHHPDESRSFIDALRRAYVYLAQHPASAAKIAVNARPGMDGKAVQRAGRALAASSGADLSSWGSIEQEEWDSCFSRAAAAKRVECEIPAHHGYILDYLKDAKK